MDYVSAAFALIAGADRTIVYANMAVRNLLGLGARASADHTIAEAFAHRDACAAS